MMRIFYCLILLTSFSLLKGKNQKESISIENLKEYLIILTKSPHAFGSKNQHKLTKALETLLKKSSLFVSKQDFQYDVPDRESFAKKDYSKLKIYKGSNIIATKEGSENCAIIIGGHYDTKHLENSSCLGANDNGSSIALMLEFARVLKNIDFKKLKSPGTCDINLIFFDGEESVLSNWYSGEKYFKKQDNLYGSRYFTENLYMNKQTKVPSIRGKPIKLVLILDMIGHKNQNLSITKGSDLNVAKELLKLNSHVKLELSDLNIKDDHSPFLKFNFPSILIIDWTNLKEWHSSKDTIDIISFEKIKNLGELVINFLKNGHMTNL